MKRLLAAVLTACFLSTTVVADENPESTTDSKSAFGLQAAPFLFGLSLRRAISDTWQVQGVLQPAGDDISVGARVLRISTKKRPGVVTFLPVLHTNEMTHRASFSKVKTMIFKKPR